MGTLPQRKPERCSIGIESLRHLDRRALYGRVLCGEGVCFACIRRVSYLNYHPLDFASVNQLLAVDVIPFTQLLDPLSPG